MKPLKNSKNTVWSPLNVGILNLGKFTEICELLPLLFWLEGWIALSLDFSIFNTFNFCFILNFVSHIHSSYSSDLEISVSDVLGSEINSSISYLNLLNSFVFLQNLANIPKILFYPIHFQAYFQL